MLYLGEISGSQKKFWNKSIKVLNEQNEPVHKTLFALHDDEDISENIDAIPLRLSGMKLQRPRAFGDCWLGCELCQYLKEQWETMFKLEYDVLLYDLTSTYFEGLCKRNPKAKFGRSKDKRSDCRQVLIALVVIPKGFSINYEVLAGNTAEKATLSRIQMLDVSIPTQDSRTLRMQRYTESELEHQLILEKLHLAPPPQAPPKIYSDQVNN